MTFTLRVARPADLHALAALHAETFNETHHAGRPGGPSFELRLSQWEQAFAGSAGPWFAFVVEDSSDQLVGFAKGTRHDGGVPGFVGELNKIYVLRRAQRHGLGRLLVGAVASRFVAEGVTSMLLFGDAASPANGFYEALGAERLFAANGAFHGGYGWRDLQALVAATKRGVP